VRAQQADIDADQAVGEDELDIPAEPTNGKRKRSNLTSAFSRGSIERWIRDFEESGNDIWALVPELARSSRRERNRSKTGINQEVEAIIGRVFDDAIKRKNKPARRRMRIHAVDLWLDVVKAVGKENAKRPAD
jgi:hypothetical protein